MIYCIRIILLGVLAFFISVTVSGKTASCDITLPSEAIEEYSIDEDSYLLSSDMFYAGRTLSYLLKSRRINASAAFCLLNTLSKDNQNNKPILPAIITQHHFSCVPKFITGRFLYINPHSRIPHPKSYYIFALKKIII